MSGTTIDGKGLLTVGSITIGSVDLLPSENIIGRVRIVDDNNDAYLLDIDGDGQAATRRKAADTVSVEGSIAVPGSATSLIPANASRRVATLTNLSVTPGEVVYLGSAGITVGAGIPLAPGDSYEDSESVDAWFGISAAGNPVVALLEKEVT